MALCYTTLWSYILLPIWIKRALLSAHQNLLRHHEDVSRSGVKALNCFSLRMINGHSCQSSGFLIRPCLTPRSPLLMALLGLSGTCSTYLQIPKKAVVSSSPAFRPKCYSFHGHLSQPFLCVSPQVPSGTSLSGMTFQLDADLTGIPPAAWSDRVASQCDAPSFVTSGSHIWPQRRWHPPHQESPEESLFLFWLCIASCQFLTYVVSPTCRSECIRVWSPHSHWNLCLACLSFPAFFPPQHTLSSCEELLRF